ncbi:MAG: nitrate transport ATP-binding subunit [Polaromonas sp.]|nr:nitrate transport ATP-binding subunit [Polaromonas sp.]
MWSEPQTRPVPAADAGSPSTKERSMQGFLKIEGLSKAFAPARPVFADVSFTIDKGEFVIIIGHSGCGKTTILNVLAGLDTATSGHVFMDNREISGPGLERGVVFQSHALMPWLTVRKNIAFAVVSRWPEWPAAKVNVHVEKFVAMVGLTAAIDKKPSQLSGGMKQRVGIARAFAIQPKMLLLDEPFGALDALTRGTIQDELMGIVREAHQTVFMITHDVDEAILLADRILLMSNGSESGLSAAGPPQGAKAPLGGSDPGAAGQRGGYIPGRIAEEVVNPLPRQRTRAGLHHLPGYYELRNHIVDFLVSRATAH